MKIIKTSCVPPAWRRPAALVATCCLVATALAEPMFAHFIQKPGRITSPKAKDVRIRFSLEGESLIDDER
jgi:hypothetical protein